MTERQHNDEPTVTGDASGERSEADLLADLYDGLPHGPWLPSPVPSDEHLWPGELPFTAFGQWGEGNMDNRVFEQDTYWVDRTGSPHLIADMPSDYRLNVMMFLRENADYYHFHAIMRSLVSLAGDTLLGNPNGDMLAYDLGATPIHELTPDEWLESTPLMRRLHQLEQSQPVRSSDEES